MILYVALGGNCGWVNVTGGEGKDRQSLELPGAPLIIAGEVVQDIAFDRV